MKTVQVSGAVSRNGQPVQSSSCANAVVQFVDTTTFALHSALISCAGGSWTFSTQLFAGTYDVSVNDPNGNVLPTTSYKVSRALAIVAPTSGMVLDVPATMVSGVVRRNGAAITSTDCGTASVVVFTDSASSQTSRVPISCNGINWAFSGNIYPGSLQTGLLVATGATFPNSSFALPGGITINSPTSGLTINVPTADVSGRVLKNGQALAQTCSQAPSVSFTDLVNKFSISIPVTCSAGGWSFSGRVPLGTYNISVFDAGGVALPTAAWTALTSLVVSGDATGITLDVPSIDVGGTVTENGAPIVSGNCTFSVSTVGVLFSSVVLTQGMISLRLRISCSSGGWTWTGRVFPGSYRAEVLPRDAPPYYAGMIEPPLPANASFLVNSSLALNAPSSNVALDVVTVVVSGRVLKNSQPVGTNDCSYPIPYGSNVLTSVEFKNAAGVVARVPVTCATADWVYSGKIYPGTMAIRFSPRKTTFFLGASWPTVPVADYPSATGISISSNQANVDVNLPFATRTFRITHNGAAMNDPQCSYTYTAGNVFLRTYLELTERSGGYTVQIPVTCAGGDWTATGPLYGGTYSVVLRPYDASAYPSPTTVTAIPSRTSSLVSSIALP